MQNSNGVKVRAKTRKSTARKTIKRARNVSSRTSVSLTIHDVPLSVHDKIKRYRIKLIGRDNKKYLLMQAYAEALREFTETLA